MEKKILKLDSEAKIEIRPFELTDLKGGGFETFRTPTLDAKKPSSTSAARSRPHSELARKDQRFQVDPALRDLLSVDDETESEIDLRVERKLAAIQKAAEDEARDRGYEEGFKRGKAEAKATFEKESQERIDRLDSLLTAIESTKDDVYRANERFLVELTFRIASSVLQREIIIDPEYLTRMIRTIVEKVGVKEQLKLIANASQMEIIYGLLPELEKKHASLKNITVEQSSLLGSSDVVIETDWNRIDATLDSQLGSLHEVVLAILEEKQHEAKQVESA